MSARSLVAFLFLLMASATLADSSESVVTIADGPIQGVVNDKYRAFKVHFRPSLFFRLLLFQGIPYATPPVGSLRWKSPKPNAPWTPKTLDGTKFTAGCPQDCHLPPRTSLLNLFVSSFVSCDLVISRFFFLLLKNT